MLNSEASERVAMLVAVLDADGPAVTTKGSCKRGFFLGTCLLEAAVSAKPLSDDSVADDCEPFLPAGALSPLLLLFPPADTALGRRP